MSTTLLLAAAIPFVVTLLVVGLLLRFAAQRLLDQPNARSSHSVPTPRGGGIGVLAGLSVCWLALTVVEHRAISAQAIGTLAALASVAGISFLDDLRPLPSRLRLLVHTAAAVLVVRVLGGFDVIAVPLLGAWQVTTVGVVLAIGWCIWLTNAYNFLDGIDGIAGAQGVAAGLAWGAIGFVMENDVLLAAGVALASASLAFLRYNWHPARIFMGDVGSATLGLTFAILPIYAAEVVPDVGYLPIAGVLAVWPFLFDGTFTLVRRLFRREDVFSAHRGHLYQRLVIAGWSHSRVAALYFYLALLTGIAAVALVAGWSGGAMLAWFAPILASGRLLGTVSRAEKRAADGVSSSLTSDRGARSSAS